EKPLVDAVVEWSKSDEGKHFVAAPVNLGGGASGGTDGKVGQKTMTRTAFDSLNIFNKMEFTKSGGTITD
ncbi:MAG: hypothetical protein QMD11_07920, partial [Smithella sp.]|nr:hypothetical protein [Smithella sp.]